MPRRTTPPTETRSEPYRHPEADSPLRPEIGTQAQFRKKKPPTTYRYDSSLSPALDWDGQNAGREQGEALIRQVLEAGTLEETKSYDPLAQVKREAALRWCAAVNGDDGNGKWSDAIARRSEEVRSLIENARTLEFESFGSERSP